jgi:hypothetical protein
MARYNILDQASALIDDKLELVRMLAENKKLLMDERSDVVCRCSACRHENERALGWLAGFEANAAPAHDGSPNQKRTKAAVERAY